jgi:hypothetical protein
MNVLKSVGAAGLYCPVMVTITMFHLAPSQLLQMITRAGSLGCPDLVRGSAKDHPNELMTAAKYRTRG